MSLVICLALFACVQVPSAELVGASALIRAPGFSVEFRVASIALPAHAGEPAVVTVAASLARDGFE